jgi:TolB-like protein
VIIIWRFIPQKGVAPAKSRKNSIAVLPFEDQSPTKGHEYLCKGIPDTLIDALTNIEGLWVPARTSSFSFESKNLGIREIGRQLDVNNLLEASVLVFGNRIRITARLTNVNNGSYVWSETYDRKMEDIFAIQDDIAQAIVKVLKVKLLGERKEPLVKKYTDNLQAYDLYLQGRYCSIDNGARSRFGLSMSGLMAASPLVNPVFCLSSRAISSWVRSATGISPTMASDS